MALNIGSRIGPYEVASLLGAGGMGEVYRARDSRLGRDVALKVLPDLLAADAERLARFQREAQVLAALNHPHIAGIYGAMVWASSLLLAAVAGAFLTAAVIWSRAVQSGSDDVPAVRFAVHPNQVFLNPGVSAIALSPDGRYLAFAAAADNRENTGDHRRC